VAAARKKTTKGATPAAKKKTATRKTGARGAAEAALPKQSFPPPWKLDGEGIVFPFFANRDYNLKHGFIAPEDRDSYLGGLGAVMLVNYTSSDVGPYYELLYIPGDFTRNGKKYKRITRIFVSSMLSVREGIKNWAIPKELADFTWRREGELTRIEVSQKGVGFFRVGSKTMGFGFPVTTAILPFSLLQRAPGSYLETKLAGKGRGRLTRLLELGVNDAIFPDPRAAGFGKFGIHATPFQLTFPIPTEHPL
jgi:Acetoacetate decarboxylase (ADC)